MTLKSDLSFTCPDSGVTFTLRPIPPLNFDDFNIAYDEIYPPPVPPFMPVKVADKVVIQPDHKDEYFRAEWSRWNSKKEAAARHFLFYMGIQNDPPMDYAPDNTFYAGTLTPGKRKALWISDQLKTTRDVQALVEGIQSLLSITEEGLEEAKNDIPPKQADSTSSNGQSSQILTPSNLITP